MTIEQNILIIIRDVVGSDDDVYPYENLVEDLGFTKSKALSSYLKLKNVYPDISISEKDAVNFVTVQDVIDYFSKQIEGSFK